MPQEDQYGNWGLRKVPMCKLHNFIYKEQQSTGIQQSGYTDRSRGGPWEILTVKEMDRLLKTSRQQIHKMIQNGELPAVKVGPEHRIALVWIVQFLSE